MIAKTDIEKKRIDELNECIAAAMKKVGVQKEQDLRHYIPGVNGQLHHLSFIKLRKTDPKELQRMVQKHILEKENPEALSSPAMPALKVKRTVDLKIKKTMINQLVNALKDSKIEGIEEVIAMLSPHQTMGQIQKLMLSMIRARKVDVNLWETYVRLVKEASAVAS